MRKRTALVLGAGASASYGFPTGWELRKKLLAMDENLVRTAEALGFSASALESFLHEFWRSDTLSIDRFLGRRLEFSGIGKRAIAWLLLAREWQFDVKRKSRPSATGSEDEPDHWYQRLLHEITGESWDELNLQWLSVVTFNYDRSLEIYLLHALASTYNKTPEEVIVKLKKMDVVHVYGLLGSPWLCDEDFIPIAGWPENRAEILGSAGQRLKVIPEGRDDEPTLLAAQKILSDAERICFLGFGFDQTNIRRLGAPNVFMTDLATPKDISGTCRGLTEAEIRRALRWLVSGPKNSSLLREHFYDMNCESFLRHNLIFD